MANGYTDEELDEAYNAYVEQKLDEADAFAEICDVTYSPEEVFGELLKDLDSEDGI